MRRTRIAATLAAMGLVMPGLSHATNGMLMEAYGPVAAGLGGAALAYDNGGAAMANNPDARRKFLDAASKYLLETPKKAVPEPAPFVPPRLTFSESPN